MVEPGKSEAAEFFLQYADRIYYTKPYQNPNFLKKNLN